MGWPRGILLKLAEAILVRNVKLDIVLCNPFCYPCQTTTEPHIVDGSTKPLPRVAANIYGYGWELDDFVYALTRTIWMKKKKLEEAAKRNRDKARAIERKKEIHDLNAEKLGKMFEDYLRLATLRVCKDRKIGDKQLSGDQWWPSGEPVGTHTKSFIVDDECYYLGSQNLYNCNHAEWGYIVDNQREAEKYLEEYWNHMWKYSYEECPKEKRYKFCAEKLSQGSWCGLRLKEYGHRIWSPRQQVHTCCSCLSYNFSCLKCLSCQYPWR